MVDEAPPGTAPGGEDREVEFLICGNCATPCYVFEMEGGEIKEAQCLVCGNDQPSQFEVGDE